MSGTIVYDFVNNWLSYRSRDQILQNRFFGFGQMFNFVLMLILAEYSSIAKRLDLKNFWYRPNVWLWPNVKKLRFGNSLD